MSSVPCVVIEADDFEAMRQTYKRNLRWRKLPLALGVLFQRMMQERDLSIRGLAREIDVPEATIRHHLDYAKAAELRKPAHPTHACRRSACCPTSR